MTALTILLLVLFLGLLVAPLCLPGPFLARIPTPFRILAGLGALAAAAFCGFGFLATFEPLEPATQWTFRAIYSVAGIAAIGGAIRLFRTRSAPATL